MGEPFIPESGKYADTGIVMPNGFSGSVEHDFGRKAQEVANLAGMAVFAYDREGTGNRTTISLSLRNQLVPSRAVQRIAQRGRNLLSYIDKAEVDSVIVVGHSGATPEAIGLTLSDTLPVRGLGLSEPIAVRNMHWTRGIYEELAYSQRHEVRAQRLQQPEPPHIKAPLKPKPEKQPEPPPYKKIGRTLAEIYHYSALWPTTFSLDGLEELTNNMPDVAIYLALAQHSLTGTNEFIYNHFLPKVAEWRDTRRKAYQKPIEADIWLHKLHSHFDRPEATRLIAKRTLELAGIELR